MKSSPRSRRGSPRKRPSFERLSGLHSCFEALRAGRRKFGTLLVKPGAERRPEVARVVELAQNRGVPVLERDFDPGFAGEGINTQGVVLEAGPIEELEVEALAEPAQGPRLLIALDGVEDPQNVGALARVAEAAGCRGMLLSRRRAPPLSPTVARASAGAIEWLPVARVTNLSRGLNYLKNQGFWVVGADPAAPESLFCVPDRVLRGDLVVVMGAEGRGLRPEVEKWVDHPVRIEMQGEVASLNVSTAAAVLLFELQRRATAAGSGSA